MNGSWKSEKLAYAPLQIIDGDRGNNYPKQNELSDSGYCLFLNAGNVTRSGFDFVECQFITEDKDNLLRKGRLSRDDIVMTTRGTIGNIGFFNNQVPYDNVRINSGMVIFRCETEKLAPSYLYHFLRSPYFKGQVNALRSGVAQPQLPIRDMKYIDIPLSPLDTQHRIADILSAYDDLIENNRRRIALLEQSARLLHKEWFVHLRFPGHEHVKITGGVPEGWEKKIISGVCDTIGGGTPSTKKSEFWEDGDILWVVPTDVTRNGCVALLDTEKRITQAGLSNSSARLVPPETILMTSRASIGYFALMEETVCTNQGFINIVPHNRDMRMYILHNLMFRVEEIRSHAGGSTYAEVSKGRFRNMGILAPPLPLCQQFNEIAYSCLRQTRLLLKQNVNLAKARDLLLPRLMNGEIAV